MVNILSYSSRSKRNAVAAVLFLAGTLFLLDQAKMLDPASYQYIHRSLSVLTSTGSFIYTGGGASALKNFGSDASISIDICELPPCELILQSNLHSERCGSKEKKWPLLVTGTPRSATTYLSRLLKSHNMQVHDDWGNPEEHGSVSWIFAFNDPDNFGPARTNGFTFEHVFHQVKDPLSSITSMCTEPIFTGEKDFLDRHIFLASKFARSECMSTSHAALEFWVEWHTFLNEMKLPTFQIETVEAKSVFRMANLESVFDEVAKEVSKSTNTRDHRPNFTWQELYTIDPALATRAWVIAHEFGYTYPNVDFDALTCLENHPECNSQTVDSSCAAPHCSSGSHPYPRGKLGHLKPVEYVNDIKGWIHEGCTEYKLANGTFIGITGVRTEGNAITDDIVEQFLDINAQAQQLLRSTRKAKSVLSAQAKI